MIDWIPLHYPYLTSLPICIAPPLHILASDWSDKLRLISCLLLIGVYILFYFRGILMKILLYSQF